MTVSVVGDFRGKADEGAKNVARYFAKALEECGVLVQRHPVEKFSTWKFYRDLRDSDPDIIHFIPGVSWRSMLFSKVLQISLDVPVVMSGVHNPKQRLGVYSRGVPPVLTRVLSPSMVFTQSKRVDDLLESHGCPTTFLQNGVDLARFRPPETSERSVARRDFDISDDEFVPLHVGHINQYRNLSVLTDLVDERIRPVVIASEHFDPAPRIQQTVDDGGVRVIDRFVEDIERAYWAADCYVFPVEGGSTIQMPLSILEAMACGCPVVTRPHPGIVHFFEGCDGLRIVESDAALCREIEKLSKRSDTRIDTDGERSTRDCVSGFSWENVAKRAIQSYEEVLHS